MTGGGRAALPYRGRAWVLGVVVPVLVTAGAVLQAVTWWPRLPEPAATHWGLDGVDAVGSLAGGMVFLGAYGGLSLVVAAVFAICTGRSAIARRTVLGIATGLATLNAGLLLAVLQPQLDVVDAYDAPDPAGPIGLALLAAVVGGALAAAAAGADPLLPADGPVPSEAPRATLEGSQAPTWRRTASASPRTERVLRIAGAALFVLGIVLARAGNMWWLAVLMAVAVALVLAMLRFVVEVGPHGMSARGLLGWPRQTVPAAEVEFADVTSVDPMGDFGGWGLRLAPDRYGTVGVVLRKGEAVRVHRSGGRRFVVTVDDAGSAVALLNTYAERARTPGR